MLCSKPSNAYAPRRAADRLTSTLRSQLLDQHLSDLLDTTGYRHVPDGWQQPFELCVIDPNWQNVRIALFFKHPRLGAARLAATFDDGFTGLNFPEASVQSVTVALFNETLAAPVMARPKRSWIERPLACGAATSSINRSSAWRTGLSWCSGRAY